MSDGAEGYTRALAEFAHDMRLGDAPDDMKHETRLGSKWIIPDVSYKHFPAVLYTNSMIHVAQELVREHGLDPGEITRIEARASRTAEESLPHDPSDYLEAWHNSAYTIAAGVYGVRPLRSWEEPRTFQRPDVLTLMRKVRFGPLREGEVTSTGNYWGRWAPVRVTIDAEGRTFEGGRDYHKLLDDEALVDKFRDNVFGIVSEQDTREIEQHCWALASLTKSRDLTSPLAAARAP